MDSQTLTQVSIEPRGKNGRLVLQVKLAVFVVLKLDSRSKPIPYYICVYCQFLSNLEQPL